MLKIGGSLQDIALGDNEITAASGASLPALARMAVKEGLSGLEFAGGIPASLGGALIMNAGAFRQFIGSIVESVDTIGFDGSRRTWMPAELQFEYRHSILATEKAIVVRARLELYRPINMRYRSAWSLF